MKATLLLTLLLSALTVLSGGALAAASGERPRLEDYPSYYQFLQALDAWKKADAKAPAPAKPVEPPAEPPAVADIDPTSELAPPPIIINGPEDLDEAVALARDIHHPDYKEKIRYRRTTHLSFPLRSIDGTDMSQASVGDALTLGEVTGGDQKMSSEQLSLMIEQERRRLLDKAGEPDTSSKVLSPGIPAATPERRSVISVTSH